MSNYITEEEQIENIKKWWAQYGNIVLTSIIVVMLLFLGFKYWNTHKAKIAASASNTYENLMQAVSNNDSIATQAYAKQLVKDYNNTIYSDAAHLILAKLAVDEQKFPAAKNELEQANYSKQFEPIAKLRLARILVTENSFDKALAILDGIKENAYLPLINETRGDIYAKMKRYPEAIKAYQAALQDERLKGIGNTFLEMKNNELSTLISSMAQ